MLGYRWEQSDDSHLYVYPYWYVRKTPDPDMRVRFRLYDSTGRLVGWELARPFFNSHKAGNWPPGTIVDDAYALTLVPGLPAGTYELTAEVEGTEEDSLLKTTSWGQVEIEATPPSYLPANQSNVRFGDSIVLNGYDLEQNGRPIPPSGRSLGRSSRRLPGVCVFLDGVAGDGERVPWFRSPGRCQGQVACSGRSPCRLVRESNIALATIQSTA